MNWEKVESTVYPVLIDTTSSKVYNYMRRNVVEKQVEDKWGNTVTYYEYEEAKINKDDWGLYQDLMAITPYKATQTAYYGESEKVFYNVPNGNISVFFNNYNGNYKINRISDRVLVTFDTLKDYTNIKIMVQ